MGQPAVCQTSSLQKFIVCTPWQLHMGIQDTGNSVAIMSSVIAIEMSRPKMVQFVMLGLSCSATAAVVLLEGAILCPFCVLLA
jgi:hypothetical protein